MPTISELLSKKKPSGKPTPTRAKSARVGGLKLKSDPNIPEKEEPTTEDRRSLSTTFGEDVPPTWPPKGPAQEVWASALQALDTELCIMPDPDPRNERAWIAIRTPEKPNNPLFLFALPMFPSPKTKNENEPF